MKKKYENLVKKLRDKVQRMYQYLFFLFRNYKAMPGPGYIFKKIISPNHQPMKNLEYFNHK